MDLRVWKAKHIDKIRVAGKPEEGVNEKKPTEVIRDETCACEVNEQMVRDKKKWKGKIQVADPICVG